ncbi:hypothetical protein J6590_047282 [Homalodisca vitripennis]|nr:hypothetical protein J6590_047282 [Homalodisca vitripennis]
MVKVSSVDSFTTEFGLFEEKIRTPQDSTQLPAIALARPDAGDTWSRRRESVESENTGWEWEERIRGEKYHSSARVSSAQEMGTNNLEAN